MGLWRVCKHQPQPFGSPPREGPAESLPTPISGWLRSGGCIRWEGSRLPITQVLRLCPWWALGGRPGGAGTVPGSDRGLRADTRACTPVFREHEACVPKGPAAAWWWACRWGVRIHEGARGTE